MSIIQEKSQKIHAPPNKYFMWLDALLLLLLAAFIISGITLVPFHGDEATYIFMSEDYDILVKKGKLSALLFDPSSDKLKQRTRLSIGSILGLSIGFARDATGIGDSVNHRWLWNSPWEGNVEQGSIPNHQLLTLARFCSASMGVLSIIFLFLIAGQLLGSRFSAWAATILFATQGDILMSFRRAMQEGPKFLFLLITLSLATYILKDLKNGIGRRRLYVFMGIASGLTLAAKQDATPLLMAIYISLALVPWWQKGAMLDILANILYLAVAGILAYATFLVSMPIFWGWWETSLALIGFSTLLLQIPAWRSNKAAKPIALAGCLLIIVATIVSPSQWLKVSIPISKMIETRKLILGVEANNYLFNLDTIENKAKFLIKTVFTSKVMYMESASFDIDPINDQIKRYETFPLHGRIGAPIWDALIIIMFVIGAWLLFKQFTLESLFIFILLFVPAIFLFAFVPLLWQRYYLILQIPYSLIAGKGAGHIWILGKQLRARLIG